MRMSVLGTEPNKSTFLQSPVSWSQISMTIGLHTTFKNLGFKLHVSPGALITSYGEHLMSFCTCTCAHLLQLDAQRPIFAKGNSRGQSVYLINSINVLLSLRARPVIRMRGLFALKDSAL